MFDTVGEFLKSGSLDSYTNITARDFCFDHGVDNQTQFNIIEPLNRVIYDQLLKDVHAFAPLVSLTATIDSFSVADGNSRLVEGLLSYASVDVRLNSTVTSVTKNKNSNSFIIDYVDQLGNLDTIDADVVVIAAPIEFTNISFVGFNMPKIVERQFVRWFVTMTGVDPSYFGMSKDAELPFDILTTESDNFPWTDLQYRGETETGVSIYKFFSNTDIQSILSNVFISYEWVMVQDWPYTFPKLKPIKDSEFQPIILSDNLYYLNTIESVASAMEVSTIAGRNIAMHIVQKSFD